MNWSQPTFDDYNILWVFTFVQIVPSCTVDAVAESSNIPASELRIENHV